MLLNAQVIEKRSEMYQGEKKEREREEARYTPKKNNNISLSLILPF